MLQFTFLKPLSQNEMICKNLFNEMPADELKAFMEYDFFMDADDLFNEMPADELKAFMECDFFMDADDFLNEMSADDLFNEMPADELKAFMECDFYMDAEAHFNEMPAEDYKAFMEYESYKDTRNDFKKAPADEVKYFLDYDHYMQVEDLFSEMPADELKLFMETDDTFDIKNTLEKMLKSSFALGNNKESEGLLHDISANVGTIKVQDLNFMNLKVDSFFEEISSSELESFMHDTSDDELDPQDDFCKILSSFSKCDAKKKLADPMKCQIVNKLNSKNTPSNFYARGNNRKNFQPLSTPSIPYSAIKIPSTPISHGLHPNACSYLPSPSSPYSTSNIIRPTSNYKTSPNPTIKPENNIILSYQMSCCSK